MTDGVGAGARLWRLRRGLSRRVLADLVRFTRGYSAQIVKVGVRPGKPLMQHVVAESLQLEDLRSTSHTAPSRLALCSALLQARRYLEALSGVFRAERTGPELLQAAPSWTTAVATLLSSSEAGRGRDLRDLAVRARLG